MSLEQEVKKLRKELEQYEKIFQGKDSSSEFSLAFKASPQLTAVIKSLYMYPVVGINALIAIADTYGHRDEHDSTYVRMLIYRVRKILKKHGIKVECRPLLGYFIGKKGKAKMKEMLDV